MASTELYAPCDCYSLALPFGLYEPILGPLSPAIYADRNDFRLPSFSLGPDRYCLCLSSFMLDPFGTHYRVTYPFRVKGGVTVVNR